jgi:Luciferase-like monooxygenase
MPASPVPSGIGQRSRRRLAQHLDPKGPLLDPAVSLAFVAAHTQRVKLGTGVIILPQRNPLVLAKELASVDVVSGGRLIFGLGVGFLKAEFDALGIPRPEPVLFVVSARDSGLIWDGTGLRSVVSSSPPRSRSRSTIRCSVSC